MFIGGHWESKRYCQFQNNEFNCSRLGSQKSVLSLEVEPCTCIRTRYGILLPLFHKCASYFVLRRTEVAAYQYNKDHYL